MNDVAVHVKDVVERQLALSDHRLRSSTRFVDDLGIDSLALVDLTLALEEEFDIDVEGDDIVRLRTVLDAIDYVERCLRAKGSPGRAPS